MPAASASSRRRCRNTSKLQREVLGALRGGRAGQFFDVADPLFVLVHVGFVDEQVVATCFFEPQPCVFAVLCGQPLQAFLGRF